MHSAGFENVVATCGTSVTAEHLHLFSQTCSKVTLLLEDQAIHRAASQIKGVGTNKNYDLHCARLPEGQSLNQILLEACGVQKMHELLVAAHPFKKDQN
jgi:DNA primase